MLQRRFLNPTWTGVPLAALALASILGSASCAQVVEDLKQPGVCGDVDSDGISDEIEGRAKGVDTDKDGKPDFRDTDADNDGIPDKLEAGVKTKCGQPVDTDKDGKPNFRDTDSDGDFIKDRTEAGAIPEYPTDTDGDGTPDYLDRDSDGDGIDDRYESSADADKDGVPNFRDVDADNDTIPDAKEKGPKYPPPVDSDKDGVADFLDADSDNDGLSDRDEVNRFKTDPTKWDTDGDGASDMVEILDPAYDPKDAKKNPKASGDFVFIVPYQKTPVPPKDTLNFSTAVSKADIVFMTDTTGSMGGELNNLKASAKRIIAAANAAIPDSAFAVAKYDDFPTSPYGSSRDVPFGLVHRIMTAKTMAGLQSIQNAVDKIPRGSGADGPESGWQALYQVATGRALTVGGAAVPAFDPLTAPPTPALPGETQGRIGGVGFRKGALPIILQATDAPSHDPDGYSKYSFKGAASSSSAIANLKNLGARVVGILSSSAFSQSQARKDLTKSATETGTIIDPADFGTGAARPPGCAAGQCCTGLNNAGVPPLTSGLYKGKCPLVYTIDGSGRGLGDSIVKAIQVVVTKIEVDVAAKPIDEAGDPVDAVKAFIKDLIPHVKASKDPKCTGGLRIIDDFPKGDGKKDTFAQIRPGTPVCFDIFIRQNVTVQPGKIPQLFRAKINVLGDKKTVLSTRKIFFVVPPKKIIPGLG